MIHIYTGDGKGKTTAACGLCVRAAGSGKKVLFAQFLKDGSSSEIAEMKKLGIDVMSDYPYKKFLWDMSENEKEDVRCRCCGLLNSVRELSEKYDVIVLDEVLGAIGSKLIDEAEVIGCLNGDMEFVLTGRGASGELCNAADYVSEIICVKHPMSNGAAPRYGIEF